jgi:cell wall-associated NlpC family hydrolase
VAAPGATSSRAGRPLLTSIALFRHTRHICFVALAILVGVVALDVAAIPQAGADPIGDKEAQAKQLQDEIEATNEQLSALGERYNGAVLRLQQTEADLAAVEAQIAATQHEVDATLALVQERSASVYRRALTGQGLEELDYSDSTKLMVRKHYASVQARRDDELLRQLDEAKAKLGRQELEAEQARAAADAERAQLEATKNDLEAKSAQQHQLLQQVQGELAQLVAQELARRQAEAQAMAQGRLRGGDGDPNLPPPGPAAAQALAFAQAQMGKTYVYAAAGPDHYDCSGLVMAAYRSAGVSLPHYSGAQYAALPHVPLDHVMPGDLIFWGTNASVHVALYYGNARILESGGSSNDVHIGPIWGHPMGAARVLG